MADLTPRAFVDAVGCATKCKRRPRGSTAWVLDPCGPCVTVPRSQDLGKAMVERVQKLEWTISVPDLAGYLTEKIPSAPWAVIDWGDAGRPTEFGVWLDARLRTTAKFSKRVDDHCQDYFVPSWLQALLDAGVFVRQIAGLKWEERPNWPKVIAACLTDLELREGLCTCFDVAMVGTGLSGEVMGVSIPGGQQVKMGVDWSSDAAKAHKKTVGDRVLKALVHRPELIGCLPPKRRA